jgi:hypothetical protein
LLAAEGKKKIKGKGEVCEGCSGVCVCGGLDYGRLSLVEGEEAGKRKLVAGKPGWKSLFCANFELPVANPLSMKIDPIYRAGKRVISSSMGKTSQPLIRLE